MKKLIFILFVMSILVCSCTGDKASILFNKHPITEKNIYDYSNVFPAGSRIYYVILMPKKVESRYIYIQIVKKDNDYGKFAYKLIQTRNIRLKDEEIHYFTDYLVLNEKGYYFMKVYSKDNPKKVLAAAEFNVVK